jgi:anti-anti-sigma regulatory factor
VTVDLRELAFTDTSLMVDLAALSNRLRRRGQELRLLGPGPQIMSMIEHVGLNRLPGVRIDSGAGALA